MTSDTDRPLWRLGASDLIGYAGVTGEAQADLLVIGGGFTGCAAALEAANRGARVVLVEAAQIGHGGSGRNVGLVNAGLWLPPDQVCAALGDDAGMRLVAALGAAPDAVFDLINTHGITCEARRAGTLHLAHAPSGLRDLEHRLAQGNRTGAPLRLLDAGETAARTGSAAFHGALFDPRAGTIQPLQYCRGLARAAQVAGAAIHEHAPVSRLTRQGDHWAARIGAYTVRADAVLMATNAYHRGIGAPRGAAPTYVPVRYSQFATAPLSPEMRAHILPEGEGAWDTAMVMSSIRTDAAGRLIVGGIGDVAGAGRGVHHAWARRKLAALYPDLRDIAFDHVWQGDIAMTSDHVPKVVKFGPNALSIFGYSGRGIGPGTVFGTAAARALTGGGMDALPLAPVAGHREPLAPIKRHYYETGAILTHAISARRHLS